MSKIIKPRKKPEYVICAAVYLDDGVHREFLPSCIVTGIVIGGLRHANCLTMLHSIIGNEKIEELAKKKIFVIQGFLSSNGRFLTRQEAFKIAKRRNQLLYPENCDVKVLYSEDIY